MDNDWMRAGLGAIIATIAMVMVFWPWPWNYFGWFRRLTRREQKADSLEYVDRYIRDHEEASGQAYRSLAEAREERGNAKLF